MALTLTLEDAQGILNASVAILHSNAPPSVGDLEALAVFREIMHLYPSLDASNPDALSPEQYARSLNRFYTLLKGVLSPLRRFPPELLGLIFTFCRDHCLEAGYTVCDERHTLMALGEVCCRWRAVLRSMRAVWNHLHFSTSAMKPCNAEVTQHLLGLSGAMRLSLCFSTMEDDDSSEGSADYIEESEAETVDVKQAGVEDSDVEQVDDAGTIVTAPIPFVIIPLTPEDIREAVQGFPTLGVLGSVADRLEHLELQATSDDLRFCGFAECEDTEYSILSSLTIRIIDLEHVFLERQLTAFRVAPSLQTLVIAGESASYMHDGSRHYSSIGDPDFPWNQLTNLILDIDIIVFEAREILCQCGAVEIATFSRLAGDDEERLGLRMTFPVVTTLHNLRELSIASDTFYASDILEGLSLPNLESLTINAWDSNFVPVLRDLQATSKFTLLHFSLLGYYKVEDICRLLSQTPSLKTLEILYCDRENALFEALTYTAPQSERSTPLLRLSNLRILTLDPSRMFGPVECPENLVKLMDSLSHFSGGCETPCPNLETLRISLPIFLSEERRKIIKEQLAGPVCADGFNLVYRRRTWVKYYIVTVNTDVVLDCDYRILKLLYHMK
ncbi:hypothetical protein R3P38DRAFT_829320 [Favolaschia claudopus]|uniref:F-box domain-containing protein n=1 Tax=Favolaschia claudopus TaxID=2862362 RepID=A0AAW0BZT3_9AGAR